MNNKTTTLETALLRLIERWSRKNPHQTGQAKNCAADLSRVLAEFKRQS